MKNVYVIRLKGYTEDHHVVAQDAEGAMRLLRGSLPSSESGAEIVSVKQIIEGVITA